MNSVVSNRSLFLSPKNIFRLFKYVIYALLTVNVFFFFKEDLAASIQVFGDTVSWRNVIEAYAATFDTAAWVVLLLMFELETAIIPDRLLKGWLKWTLKGFSLVAYLIIIYSFYGYVYKYGVITDLVPFSIDDVCSLVGSHFTYVFDLDDYLPLDQAACTAMNAQELLQIAGTDIIGTQAALVEATRLAIVDVINAADWLIIVLLLEAEVYLQMSQKLTDRMMVAGKYIKGFFYMVLFAGAAYWGVKGSFLDFWDAFLWLVAFILIELNIFQWHSETDEALIPAATGGHAPTN